MKENEMHIRERHTMTGEQQLWAIFLIGCVICIVAITVGITAVQLYSGTHPIPHVRKTITIYSKPT